MKPCFGPLLPLCHDSFLLQVVISVDAGVDAMTHELLQLSEKLADVSEKESMTMEEHASDGPDNLEPVLNWNRFLIPIPTHLLQSAPYSRYMI